MARGPLSVAQWTEFHATFRPDGTALRFGEEATTWAELDDRVGRFAAGLAASGVRRGDRVAILLRNHPAFIEIVLATARVGATFVPLNVMLTAPELSHIVGHSNCSVLITEMAFSSEIARMTTLPKSERIFYFGATPPVHATSTTCWPRDQRRGTGRPSPTTHSRFVTPAARPEFPRAPF